MATAGSPSDLSIALSSQRSAADAGLPPAPPRSEDPWAGMAKGLLVICLFVMFASTYPIHLAADQRQTSEGLRHCRGAPSGPEELDRLPC